MTKTDERTPALLIDGKTSHLSGMDPILEIVLHPVYITSAGEIRNYSSSGFDSEPLADLIVRASYDPKLTSPGTTYAWATEYKDVYSVDLRRAEGMVKTLRKVDRGLERAQMEWGHPDTFAAYAMRVAKALGIKTYGYKADGRSNFYDGNDYRWVGAADLQYRINHLIAEHDKAREGAPA